MQRLFATAAFFLVLGALTTVTVLAQDTCPIEGLVPVVDSFGYRRGSDTATFRNELLQGERFAELFYTSADLDYDVLLRTVSLLVNRYDEGSTPGTGRVVIWSDDGAGPLNSLPLAPLYEIGEFDSPAADNTTVTFDVYQMNIYLTPDTPYWFVLRALSGTIRWAYSDYAYQDACPEEDGEGRFGQRYAKSLASTNATTDPVWSEQGYDYGFISIFSLLRCASNETQSPSPVPTPSGAPTPSVVPTPSAAPTPSISVVPTPSTVPSPIATPLPSYTPIGRPSTRPRSVRSDYYY